MCNNEHTSFPGTAKLLKIQLAVIARIGIAVGWVVYDLNRAFRKPALTGKLRHETIVATTPCNFSMLYKFVTTRGWHQIHKGAKNG
ncbi:MAG TPA: hypothetical protein VKV95_02990 [Terriglobia bacterium]|nr:hypothetical protein [Terriglobia bacterium]